jgi:hypothetical protein
MKKTRATIINYRPWNGSYWAYRMDSLDPDQKGGELIARGDTIEECRDRVFEWLDEKRQDNFLRSPKVKKSKIPR